MDVIERGEPLCNEPLVFQRVSWCCDCTSNGNALVPGTATVRATVQDAMGMQCHPC